MRLLCWHQQDALDFSAQIKSGKRPCIRMGTDLLYLPSIFILLTSNHVCFQSGHRKTGNSEEEYQMSASSNNNRNSYLPNVPYCCTRLYCNYRSISSRFLACFGILKVLSGHCLWLPNQRISDEIFHQLHLLLTVSLPFLITCFQDINCLCDDFDNSDRGYQKFA